MRNFVAVLCALVSAGAWAQEIGTEIPAGQQQQQQQQQQPSSYDNPYGQQPTPPPPPPAPGTTAGQPVVAAEGGVPGLRKGAFGLRASFGGSAVPGAPATGTVASTPTIGMKYVASDSVALTFDIGTAVGISNRFAFGLGLGLGVEAYMGSNEKPLRPFVVGELALSKPFSTDEGGWAMGINAGFGAEYFFSDYFSLQGRALIGVPLNFEDLDPLVIATFQPGVGATFYF